MFDVSSHCAPQIELFSSKAPPDLQNGILSKPSFLLSIQIFVKWSEYVISSSLTIFVVHAYLVNKLFLRRTVSLQISTHPQLI